MTDLQHITTTMVEDETLLMNQSMTSFCSVLNIITVPVAVGLEDNALKENALKDNVLSDPVVDTVAQGTVAQGTVEEWRKYFHQMYCYTTTQGM